MWQNERSANRALASSTIQTTSRNRFAPKHRPTSSDTASSGIAAVDRVKDLKNRYEVNRRTSSSLSPLRVTQTSRPETRSSYVPDYTKKSYTTSSKDRELFSPTSAIRESKTSTVTTRRSSKSILSPASKVLNSTATSLADRLFSPERSYNSTSTPTSNFGKQGTTSSTRSTTASSRTRVFSPSSYAGTSATTSSYEKSSESYTSKTYQQNRTTRLSYDSSRRTNDVRSPQILSPVERNTTSSRLLYSSRSDYKTINENRSKVFSPSRTDSDRLFSPERVTEQSSKVTERIRLFSPDRTSGSTRSHSANTPSTYRKPSSTASSTSRRRGSITSGLESRRDSLNKEIQEFQNILNTWGSNRKTTYSPPRHERTALSETRKKYEYEAPKTYTSVTVSKTAAKYSTPTATKGHSSASESDNTKKRSKNRRNRQRTKYSSQQESDPKATSSSENDEKDPVQAKLSKRRKRLAKSKCVLLDSQQKGDFSGVRKEASEDEALPPSKLCLNYLEYWNKDEDAEDGSGTLKGAKKLITAFESGTISDIVVKAVPKVKKEELAPIVLPKVKKDELAPIVFKEVIHPPLVVRFNKPFERLSVQQSVAEKVIFSTPVCQTFVACVPKEISVDPGFCGLQETQESSSVIKIPNTTSIEELTVKAAPPSIENQIQISGSIQIPTSFPKELEPDDLEAADNGSIEEFQTPAETPESFEQPIDLIGPAEEQELPEVLTEMTTSLPPWCRNSYQSLKALVTPSNKLHKVTFTKPEATIIQNKAVKAQTVESPGNDGPSQKLQSTVPSALDAPIKTEGEDLSICQTSNNEPSAPKAPSTSNPAQNQRVSVAFVSRREALSEAEEDDSSDKSMPRMLLISKKAFEIRSIVTHKQDVPLLKVKVGKTVDEVPKKDSPVPKPQEKSQAEAALAKPKATKTSKKPKESQVSLSESMVQTQARSEELVVKIVDPARSEVFKIDRSLTVPKKPDPLPKRCIEQCLTSDKPVKAKQVDIFVKPLVAAPPVEVIQSEQFNKVPPEATSDVIESIEKVLEKITHDLQENLQEKRRSTLSPFGEKLQPALSLSMLETYFQTSDRKDHLGLRRKLHETFETGGTLPKDFQIREDGDISYQKNRAIDIPDLRRNTPRHRYEPFESERRVKTRSYHPDFNINALKELEAIPGRAVYHESTKHSAISLPPPQYVDSRKAFQEYDSRLFLDHSMPPPDQEVIDLLKLGDELQLQRKSLRQKSGAEASKRIGAVTLPKPVPQRAVQTSMEDMARKQMPKLSERISLDPHKDGVMLSSMEFSGSSRADSTIPTDPEVFHSTEDLPAAISKAKPRNITGSRDSVQSIPQDPVFAKTMTPTSSATPELRAGHTTVRISPRVSAGPSPLETATRQIEDFINNQRHQHHQTRSMDRNDRGYRFKRAMMQLDAVYETLQQECAMAGLSHQSPRGLSKEPSTSSYSSAYGPRPPGRSDSVERYVDHILDQAHHQTALPQKEDIRNLVPDPHTSLAKMDFTQKWLDGDLTSWKKGESEVAVVVSDRSIDADEESLGSGSVEVAGIFGRDSPKKRVKKPQPYQKATYEFQSLRRATEESASLYSHQSAENHNGYVRSTDSHLAVSYERLIEVARKERRSHEELSKQSPAQCGKRMGRGAVKNRVAQLEHLGSGTDESVASLPVRGTKSGRPGKLPLNSTDFLANAYAYDTKQLPGSLRLVELRSSSTQKSPMKQLRRHSTHSLPNSVPLDIPSLAIFDITEDPILEAMRSPSPSAAGHNGSANFPSNRTLNSCNRSSNSTLVGSPGAHRKQLRQLVPSGPTAPPIPHPRRNELDDIVDLVAELELKTEEPIVSKAPFPAEAESITLSDLSSGAETSAFEKPKRMVESHSFHEAYENSVRDSIKELRATASMTEAILNSTLHDFSPHLENSAYKPNASHHTAYDADNSGGISGVLQQVNDALASLDAIRPSKPPLSPTTGRKNTNRPLAVPRKTVYLTESMPKPNSENMKTASAEAISDLRTNKQLDLDAHFADLLNYRTVERTKPHKTTSQSSLQSLPPMDSLKINKPIEQAGIPMSESVHEERGRNPVKQLLKSLRSSSRERNKMQPANSTHSLDVTRLNGTKETTTSVAKVFKGYDKHTTNSSFEYRHADDLHPAQPPPAPKRSVRERVKNWTPWRR